MRHVSMYLTGLSLLCCFVMAFPAFPFSSGLQEAVAGDDPAYEVAAVHVSNPNRSRLIGFYSYPGGQVKWGSQTLKDLLSYAYNVPPSLVRGGPPWTNETSFDIEAIAPLKYRQLQSDLIVNPNAIQRVMLRNLLLTRFGLSVEHDSRSMPVLMLLVKKPSPNLRPSLDPSRDPHGGIVVHIDGAVTGQAFGENMTMAYLAEELAERLEYPVIDGTELRGGYDFHLDGVEGDNHDMQRGLDLVLDRLGLTLRRAKRSVNILFVEKATLPTPN
jgi:uncharacterized protein (TIGR03435 family)